MLGRVAQRVILVAALRERRDAAGQGPPVGGEIHCGPGASAQRPWVLIAGTLQARLGLRCAGRGEQHAVAAGEFGRGIERRGFLPAQPLEQGLVRPGQADRRLVEKDQPLQMHFTDADLVGDLHEGRQLLECFLQARQPERDLRQRQIFAYLHFAERAHVANDAVEIVPAAHQQERLGVSGIERHAQFVEARISKFASLLRRQQRAVGVEEYVGTAGLQVAHHARQILDEHGLAHPVQHDAGDVGDLVDDAREQLPAHVGFGLERVVGARAGRAQEVAAVGRLQIKAHWHRRRVRREFCCRLVIAVGVHARGRDVHLRCAPKPVKPGKRPDRMSNTMAMVVSR